jgi:hypothetical protein
MILCQLPDRPAEAPSNLIRCRWHGRRRRSGSIVLLRTPAGCDGGECICATILCWIKSPDELAPFSPDGCATMDGFTRRSFAMLRDNQGQNHPNCRAISEELRTIDAFIVRWVSRKYKRFWGHVGSIGTGCDVPRHSPICGHTKASAKRALRSAGIWGSIISSGRIRAWMAARPIEPISMLCQWLWQHERRRRCGHHSSRATRRVGAENYSPAPLTEPYLRTTHTAPWINRSEPQQQLG